jgi:hypothetical protein
MPSTDRSATAGFFRRHSMGLVVVLAMLLAATLFVAAACGGSDDPTATTAAGGSATTAAATPTSEAAAALSADELGEQIGVVYVGSIEAVALLLKDKPEAATVKAQVQDLKDSTIAQLVELGKAREAMSTSDRAKADLKINAALTAAGSKDWYTTYNDVWKHYSAADAEFGNLIAAFNIIGQYANFDLLKQQLPEEATRLGIK